MSFAQAGALESIPTDLLCDAGRFALDRHALQRPLPVHDGAADIVLRMSRACTMCRSSVSIRTGAGPSGSAQRGTVCGATPGGQFSSYTTEDGLSGDEIMSMFEDREGNLWVGVSSARREQIHQQHVHDIPCRVRRSSRTWSGPLVRVRTGRSYASSASGKIFTMRGRDSLQTPHTAQCTMGSLPRTSWTATGLSGSGEVMGLCDMREGRGRRSFYSGDHACGGPVSAGCGSLAPMASAS